ncbi:MAG: DUF2807 domain-containing protein [Alphaproteobacteria bacterium]|nr:DUF2807 domain-containing protein [Alphaproteobacteria bacterium]
MIEKRNLLIGGGILLGLYLLNPFSGSHRGAEDDAEFNYQSNTLKIVNFIGKVEMTTSSDGKIHIQATNIAAGLTPNFDHIAGKLEISGNEKITSISCSTSSLLSWAKGDDSDLNITINGGSSRKLSEFPTLQIQAPATVNLILEKNLIFGQFSQTDKLTVGMLSCGNLNFDQVKNDVRIDIRGSGNIDIKSVGGSANSSIRGSGDIHIGSIAQDSVSQILGSGNITYDDITGIHKMSIRGSGDIDVNQITGDAEISLRGSGDVDIDDGDLNWLIATVQGSGDIDYGGTATNRRLVVRGSGEINTKYD